MVLLLDGHPLPGLRALTPRESDIAISYGVRNKTAHGLERPAATTLEFDRIANREAGDEDREVRNGNPGDE